MTDAERYIQEAVQSSSGWKNYAGMGPQYAGMPGFDLPKDVDTSKMSGRQLKALYGWQSLTISLDALTAQPTQSIAVQLFNVIHTPGVAQANGSVFFPDPANAAKGVYVTASRDTYSATRAQTQTRAMNVKLVRMVVGTSSDFSQPFSYFKVDSFGNTNSYILIADEDFSPFQYQSLRADLPLDPTHEVPHMGLIREDTGFQYTIQPGSQVRFILFIDHYHSPAMGLHPAMAHPATMLKGK